jgi:class 3 adenylate cyclase
VAALLLTCPSCGAPQVPTERKLGTLLFADLAGYTALCNRLDPEVVHGMVRPAMAALRRVVEAYGAALPQGIQGDGFMAVFGAPLAHEDDAERAVRAGLAAQEHHAAAQARATGEPLPDLRVGIASGEVYVAPSPDAGGFSVTGEAVNLAARLCALARPGQVLVTDRARELTRTAIEYGTPRDRVVKGFADRVTVVRAVRTAAGASAGRRALPADTPFVDREDVFAHLDAAWHRVVARRTSEVVVVVGDAGQGKSRVAHEYTLRRKDADVLTGGCAPYGEDSSLGALRTALARRFAVSLPARADDLAPELRGYVGALGLGDSAAFLADWLAALLSGEERGAGVDTAFGALRLLFEALGRTRPVLLVVDDLHWAGPDESELLRRVAAQPWDASVLVLCLTRPDVAGLPDVPPVELGALDRPHLSMMLNGLIGAVPSPRVVDELAARTGGNPLFLEECVALLHERGAIDADAARVDRHELARVPNSMRMFIAGRLDTLPAAEKALLQDASVIGPTFWDTLLIAAGARPGLDELVASLERRGFVRRVVPGSVPGAVELRFRHALIRDVAYESLSRRARADRHRLVAEALGQMRHGGGSEYTPPLSLLAHHYAAAWREGRSDVLSGRAPCEPARLAVDHLLAWATEIGATQPRRAEDALAQALSVAEAAPECIADAVRNQLLVAHAEALVELARAEEGLAEADRALALATTVADPALVARSRLVLARALSESGRVAESTVAVAVARREFAELGDVSGEADALWVEAMNLRWADMARHIQLSRDVFDAYARAGRRDQQAWLAQDLAYLLTLEGGPDQRRWAAEALRLIDRDTDLRGRAALTRNEALLAEYRRDLTAALSLARDAAEDAYDSGAGWVEADALLCQQAALIMTGELDHAARLHARVVALTETLNAPRLRAMTDLVAAQHAARARRPGTVAELVASARVLLEPLGSPLDLLFADSIEAAIALDAGRWSDVAPLAGPLVSHADGRGWGLFGVPQRVLIARAGLALDPVAAAGSLADALDATRRHDVPLLGALAAACVEQAQLLAGSGTTASIGDGGAGLVETRATYAENTALRALRSGDYATAARRFEDAAHLWDRLGATVWLARALLWEASCLRRAGEGDAADGVEEPVPALLTDLAAPDGLAESLRAALPR